MIETKAKIMAQLQDGIPTDIICASFDPPISPTLVEEYRKSMTPEQLEGQALNTIAIHKALGFINDKSVDTANIASALRCLSVELIKLMDTRSVDLDKIQCQNINARTIAVLYNTFCKDETEGKKDVNDMEAFRKSLTP